MSLDITELKGVGDSIAQKLKVLGLHTVDDLIWNFPRRYDDYSEVSPVAKLRPGAVTIEAKIKQATGRYVRRGMHITEALAGDNSGSVRLVWFNQPYRANALKKDQTYFISGTYELSRQRFAIMNPNVELVSSFPVNTARIVPIYRETKGLKSTTIRKIMLELKAEIESYPEILPPTPNTKMLPSRQEALKQIHFPSSAESLSKAKHRLGFEEVFGLTLAALLNKQANASEKAPEIKFNEKLARKFVSKLPFRLTNAQRKVVWQIYLDMQKTVPMNRLIEGDVGSGKTVVAAMSALMVLAADQQVALMAPTELLARQHAETLRALLDPFPELARVTLLTGSMKAAEKVRARKALTSGACNFVIGTHALISDTVAMKNLALIVVDEQHRFGVDQRQKLHKKAGHMPHMLSMTATPIPRTLALTVYGELEISIIDEKPANRKAVITEIVSPNSRKQLYAKLESEIELGRQIFVVCPLIEESDMLIALSAEKVYEQLSKTIFKTRRVGLLHGQMKSDAKETIMQDFIDGKLDILVSTTVIEVGVDVPNASVMVIEGAERFGLAQIHQLRGRVGRNEYQGYCYMVMSDSAPPTKRLRAAEQSSDGFKLAEMDLEIRGPGAIYGKSQSGQLDLRMANLSDTKLIAEARKAAQDFIDSGQKLKKYPELAAHVAQYRSITTLN